MTVPLTVVKIGGSLLGSRRLRKVLLALPSDRGLVLVPGGGPFADAVRTAQGATGFDDALAHRLALDAMGGMAQVVGALRPDIVILRNPSDVAAAARAGRLPVWDPAALRDGHPDIPESWAVTSDSLSLWLALTLPAPRLILLKSLDAPSGADARRLAAMGFVDEAFPAFAAGYRGSITVLGPGADLAHLVTPARDPDALAGAGGMLDPAAP